ncbi:hypothetical protein YC2023_036717 [Brassica napus]
MEKMERSKVSFKWRELYEAKLKVVEEDEKEAVDRLKQRYKNEDARKQSRQTKLCAKTPPMKKPFWVLFQREPAYLQTCLQLQEATLVANK